MNAQKALTHLIRAGRDALNIDNTLTTLGYKDTPYFNLYGEISDAIYCLLDEDADSFEESAAYAAMNSTFMPEEYCAEQLVELMDASPAPERKPELDIPNSTRSVIAESAERIGIDFRSMVNLILSQWACNELLLAATCKA